MSLNNSPNNDMQRANDGDSSDSANVDSDDDSIHGCSTASTARRDSDDEAKEPTLEEKIKLLSSVSDEDANEAMLLVEKHPDDQAKFHHLANIMPEVVTGDQNEFTRQLCADETKTHLIDFFALIGGAKATVEVYTNQVKVLGVPFLTEKLFEEDQDREKQQAVHILKQLRSFLLSATDKSTNFAAHLAEANLFPYLVDEIKNFDSEFNLDSFGFAETSVGILHNSARNNQLRQYFRNISLVHPLKCLLARTKEELKLMSLLTLSYIIDEKDNHLLLADDSDFDFLLNNIRNTWTSSKHHLVQYSLEELLQGLGNLAQNDDNKKLLMKKGVLTHLKPILETGSYDQKQDAATIVWKLAFYNENKRLMKGDAELMIQLYTLKNSGHCGVAESCNGALWVLDQGPSPSISKPTAPPGLPPPPGSGGAPPPPPPASAPPKGQGQGHIMISYNWGNQKRIKQVRDSLRNEGFQVWMDIDNMKGSTLQAMAKGVEGASAFLMCMSQRYKDSPNCRTEAEYAFSLHKPIIPLLLERGYKPDGWLGMLRGTKLFFDFSGKFPYEQKANELVKELEDYREELQYMSRMDTNQLEQQAEEECRREHIKKTYDEMLKDMQSWCRSEAKKHDIDAASYQRICHNLETVGRVLGAVSLAGVVRFMVKWFSSSTKENVNADTNLTSIGLLAFSGVAITGVLQFLSKGSVRLFPTFKMRANEYRIVSIGWQLLALEIKATRIGLRNPEVDLKEAGTMYKEHIAKHKELSAQILVSEQTSDRIKSVEEEKSFLDQRPYDPLRRERHNDNTDYWGGCLQNN